MLSRGMDHKNLLLVLADGAAPVEWLPSLERAGFHIQQCDAGLELRNFSLRDASLILIRWSAGDAPLAVLLKRLSHQAGLPTIVVQAGNAPDIAASARAAGACDYLREPVSVADLVASVDECLAQPHPMREAAAGVLRGGERMLGGSVRMSEVRNRIARIAAAECNVLITGETGTGKELAAELIHANSRRHSARFVCVNCAAIPETLLESELFGHERGAFTGAHSAQPGHLELADGGVLFLDEIGELSLAAQAKILRAIEGKEVQRLGRRAGVKVDVRLVSATNRNLEADVAAGTFRADLFFRLNVARLELPPLRDRKEDLRELVEYYLRELNPRMGLRVHGFSEHSWRSLLSYAWPGNVRELKNVIEASLVRIPFPRMRIAELPGEFHQRFAGTGSVPTESERLLAALSCHNWNRSKAAQELHWSRMTLYRKMVKYQLASGDKAQGKIA